jgi:hypothetical protein
MRNLGFATIVASGLAATVLGLAAPAVVNHVGSTPLSQATDPAVRPGHTYSRTDSGNPGDDLLTTVTVKTVYVDVK